MKNLSIKWLVKGVDEMSKEDIGKKSSGSRQRFVYQDDDILEKPFDWGQMVRLMRYMKPYSKKLLPIVIVLMIVVTLTKLAVPLLITIAIDDAITAKKSDYLILLVSVIGSLYVVNWIANVFRIRYTNVIGQRVIYDLRHDLFRHIQQLSFSFFDKRPAGSVLVRITNDVNSLQDLFTNGVINILMDLIMLFGIATILFTLNFKLALAMMITVPIMFFLSTKLRRRIRRAWQGVRVVQARLNAHLNESIQGIRVTQAFTQEKENMSFFREMNQENNRVWKQATKKNDAFSPLVEVTSAFGTLILFWFGANLQQAGSITVGILVGFAFYIGNFWEPIMRLGQMYSQLLVAMASSERIFEFIDTKPTVEQKENAKDISEIQGKVEFDNIVFEYEKDRQALKGISLSVHAGETVALVGHTGSGKSTIINLLCRFYDTTKGSILIDGTDIKDVTLESLRSQVGLVMQETFIFSGTIRDNLRFGRLDATDEEIELAARAARAHEFIVKLPQGYDTEVEERGNILSAGERQLLSFARTILADPRILILDEATASIDTETEVKIQEALKTLLSGRTSFLIAHRLSTIKHADKIVVLDHGQIIEMGNHEQLMKEKGVYYGLIQAQFKFFDAI